MTTLVCTYTDTHTQFGSVHLEGSELLLGGVRVAGVHADPGCRGAAVVGRAPPQVLKGLQEGTLSSLLLQWRGALLLHLCDFNKGNWLCLETSFTTAARMTFAPCWALGDWKVLGELLHGRGHEVCWQDGEPGGFQNHLTYSSHCWNKRVNQ